MAMDAWANISHFLDYKSDADIPSDLKRDFYAISGLFYVADKHFEMFFNASRESRKQARLAFQKNTDDYGQEINLDTLAAYLRDRLPDRRHSSLKAVSELVDELSEAGYRQINEIERALGIGWDALLKYESDHPPTDEKTGNSILFADVGVILVLFGILDDDFRQAYKDRIYSEYRQYVTGRLRG